MSVERCRFELLPEFAGIIEHLRSEDVTMNAKQRAFEEALANESRMVTRAIFIIRRIPLYGSILLAVGFVAGVSLSMAVL